MTDNKKVEPPTPFSSPALKPTETKTRDATLFRGPPVPFAPSEASLDVSMYERTEEDYSKWKKAQSKSDYSDDDDEETNVKQKKEKEKEKNDKSERNKKDYIDSTSDDGKETIRFSLIQNNPERINQKICPECGLIIIESLEQQHEDGHMVEILPHLYLGDFKNAANKHELQKKEIKCIVNVTKELSCKFPDEMEYTKIEWDDDDSVNIKPDLERTSQWIHERLEQKRNVLVHCQMGCSRSPTVVIGYLMLKKGYSFKDALNHVELKKPDISPRRSFREQLQDLLKPEFVASVQKWKPKRQQQQASVPTEEIKKEHESKDQQPSRRMMTKEEFDALENDTAVAIRRSKARKGAFVTAEQAKKE